MNEPLKWDVFVAPGIPVVIGSLNPKETRQYIRDFDRVADTTTTAREIYDKMLELDSERVNPGALWSSARAIKS